MTTKIASELAVDPPLVMDSNYRFGPQDRRYIDDQVRAISQHLINALIRGRHATYLKVASTSVSLAAGDVVCLANVLEGEPKITKASAQALADAVGAFGVAVLPAAPGSFALIAFGGVLPNTITGLAINNAGFVRANPTTGRCERVATLQPGDYGIGVVTKAGDMLVVPGIGIGVAAGGGVNGATNIGGGPGEIFKQLAGGQLELRTIDGAGGIDVQVVGDKVVIDGSGVAGGGTPGGNNGDIQYKVSDTEFGGLARVPVDKGGTGLDESDLSGQAGKALVVNVGENGYTFVEIPAGATVPTGTGFRRVTDGTEEAAAEAVNLEGGSTYVTGVLPVDNGGTGLDESDLSGQAGKALVVNVGEDGYTFVEIPAGASVPTGTGFRHVVNGVEDAAAKLVENADVATNANIAVTKLATGSQDGQVLCRIGSANGFQYIVNANIASNAGITVTKLAAGSANTVLTTNGSGTITWGAISLNSNMTTGTLPINKGGTGVTTLPGSTGNPLINSSGAFGAATDWTFSSSGGLVGGSNSFIALGGGTVPTTGLVRIPFNNNASMPVIIARGTGGNDRLGVSWGPGDAWWFGSTGTDFQARGVIATMSFSGNCTISGFVTQIVGTSSLLLWISSTAAARISTSGGIKLNLPLGGSSEDASPFRWKTAEISNAGTNVTLTASQAECVYLRFVGTPSGSWTISGAPSRTGAFYIIENLTDFLATIGSASIPAASIGIVIHTGSTYRLVALSP